MQRRALLHGSPGKVSTRFWKKRTTHSGTAAGQHTTWHSHQAKAACKRAGPSCGAAAEGPSPARWPPTWQMHQLMATWDSVFLRRAAISPITCSSGCRPGSTCLRAAHAYGGAR